jgi:NodT family efflux transporter outer membrane factor (OMF) lipoprotein
MAAVVMMVPGCRVGPNYKQPSGLPPSETMPPEYKETGTPPPGWKVAEPRDTEDRGKWWEVFDDPTLNTLEDQAEVSNQNLKASLYAYEAAVEEVKVVRSQLYPTLTAGPNISRNRESQNQPLLTNPYTTYNEYLFQGGFSYEIDVWGRIRRMVTQAKEEAQASAADLATLNLSMHALIAQDYFTLRGLDLQHLLLANSIDSYKISLELTEDRFKGGLVSEVDVAEARTQLESTRQQYIDTGVARAEMEHAIAQLVGKPASTFSIAPSALDTVPPSIPAQLPSELLERRPDVAAAERRAAAANEEIGIQKAAYYPTFLLNLNGGFEGTTPGNWFTTPSALWTIGAQATQTLFDAGRRHALTQQARDQYEQQVALYRDVSLTAFQQVEDNLAAIRLLAEEDEAEQAAVSAAQRSVELNMNRYKGGLETYLDVVTAQVFLVNTQVTAANIRSREFQSTVLLVQALGGSWDRGQLPKL